MRIQAKQQQGSVLVISLLILLVLTIIGATSLNSTVMEEKMASNFQTGNTASQAAESAINLTFANIAWNGALVNRVVAANTAGNPQLNFAYNMNGSPANATATIQYVTANEPCPDSGSDVAGTHSMVVYGTGTVNNTGVSRTHTAGVVKCFFTKTQ
jgi:type IV pilus assembly protein PilX